MIILGGTVTAFILVGLFESIFSEHPELATKKYGLTFSGASAIVMYAAGALISSSVLLSGCVGVCSAVRSKKKMSSEKHKAE